MSVIKVGSNVELLDVFKVKALNEKINMILLGVGVAESRSELESVSETSRSSYRKAASMYFDIDEYDLVTVNKSVEEIIESVRQSNTLATLRFHATAIRFFACYQLDYYAKTFSNYLEAYKLGFTNPYKLYCPEEFYALLALADIYPSEYRRDDWIPKKRRRSKIWSLKGLPENWQRKMAIRAWKEGVRYLIPVLVALVTGLRPSELQKGVLLTIQDGKLVALIQGAKVTEQNGQPTRELVLADHIASKYLIAYMKRANLDRFIVKVKSGDAVSSTITRLGKKIRNKDDKNKDNLTLYTARHAFASDCKKVDSESGEENPLITSGGLGHRSDRTKGTYGSIRYGSGSSGGVAPASVKVPCEIRVHAKRKDFVKSKIKSRAQRPSF